MRYALAAMITPVIENGRMVMKGEDLDRNMERIKAFLKRAEDEAAELVAKYENAIDALAALLRKRGSIPGDEVVRFLTI
ncbi:hypothetical protein V5E97_09680 [Singulisphaera sp. Ch08]|uniref:Uncharacterized protein n=1 Tax=Singulisphaera sp. Ch08 TaxID=3120278 RepID=A0AAU7CNW0_9BACT